MGSTPLSKVIAVIEFDVWDVVVAIITASLGFSAESVTVGILPTTCIRSELPFCCEFGALLLVRAAKLDEA